MFDVKVAVRGGFSITHCHSDNIEVVNRAVDADLDASEIAFMEGHKPVSVHDLLSEHTGVPAAPPHDGQRNVIIARFLNQYGMPAALVCDSELYVVNERGQTVSVHRT